MRSSRRIALAVILLTAFAVSPGGASSTQEVSGRIRLAVPQGAEIARRAFVSSDGSQNGLTGFVFGVDPETVNGRFELRTSPGTLGAGEASIIFYDDVIVGTVCAVFSIPGDEHGSPCGTHAIVTLETGVDVPFLYAGRARESNPPPRPTPSSSPTPTTSPTPSPSPTPTISPTPTTSPSPSASPSPSPSPKPVPSGGPAVAYQMTPVHDGLAPATNLAPPLVAAWSRDLGVDLAYPVVADGRIHVVVPEQTGTTLMTYDLATGEPLWGPEDIDGNWGWARLALDGGRVFAITGDGLLSAFDAEDGSLRWSVDLPVQHSFSAPPTATGGVVYVGGAGSGGTVYAVSGSTGELLWTQGVSNGDRSSPTVTADGVFVAYACQQTYRLDVATGEVVWHHSTGCSGGGGATAPLHGGKLYDLNSGYPSAEQVVLDEATGDEVGTFVASQPPAFDGDLGFFLSAGTLRGKRLSTDETLWSFAGHGGLLTAPIVANGHVYVGSDDGDLWVLDEGTGEVAWSGDVGAPITNGNALVAAEGYLVVTASSELLVYH